MAVEDITVRTAVVIVHGMGEKRPMETFDSFVRTALHPRDGIWHYQPRAAEITDTYEARRYFATSRETAPQQGHTEFFEYHWPFLMTAGKFAGVAPTALRLFLRRPSNVPDALLGVWRLVWGVVLAALLVIPTLFVAGYALNSDVPAWIIGLTISAVVLIFWFGLYRMMARALVNKKTVPLVDSARYLDPSPPSYAARRAIRGGLVELLGDLHEDGYGRIVLVAHGVGAYIAYDALTLSWTQTHQKQGKPWCITDFVTIGAPLALADLVLTRPPLASGLKTSDGTLRRELSMVCCGAACSSRARPSASVSARLPSPPRGGLTSGFRCLAVADAATGSAASWVRCSAQASATSQSPATNPNGSSAGRRTPSTSAIPTRMRTAISPGISEGRWRCRRRGRRADTGTSFICSTVAKPLTASHSVA